jgi:hypothetical protein
MFCAVPFTTYSLIRYTDKVLAQVSSMYARTTTHGVKVSIVPATTTAAVIEDEKATLLDAVIVRHIHSLPLEVRSHYAH